MNFNELTDTDIEFLLAMPKQVTNPGAKWKMKPGHNQKNFTVRAGEHDFQIYMRQNLSHDDDFSCGLKIIKPDGQPLTLLRYNGPSHIHGEIAFQCHIHRASELSMKAGRKPESEAKETDRYRTLEGALFALVSDCAISGLSGVSPDEPDLFNS